jgi:caffeoyl-CoA O-methyltransferase
MSKSVYTDIDEYILDHIDKEDDILYELNRLTHLKAIHPRMLSGHLQGAILTMLCRIINPKRVLEIGTFTGYSAICMARGMQPDACIDTIEVNDEIAEIPRLFFEKCGLTEKINLHVGNALNIIPSLPFEYDLVFIDAEKTEYSSYYDLVFDKISQGGIILADNVLWSGKVLTEPHKSDYSTLAIREFNCKVANDSRVEKVIMPIRDGLTIIRKK